MINFIIIIVVVIAVLIIRRYLRQRIEQRLRENPPPRRQIEISLPRGIEDADDRMAKFLRKVSSAALGDKKSRQAGLRQIDIVYYTEVKRQGSLPTLRYFIYADEDKMDSVKRAVKNAFEGQANVIEIQPEDDPLADVAERLRPGQEEEPEMRAPIGELPPGRGVEEVEE
jgi:hypothetical protein